jgi:hypothetical protein
MRESTKRTLLLNSGSTVASRGGQWYARLDAWFVISLLAMTIVNCGGSTTAPSTSSLNLSGTWSGVVGAGSGGGRALRVTWVASQASSNVSGPATLLTSPPVTDLTFAGTLAGTLTGTQLSLTYTALPGSIAGFATCSVSGRGSAAATSATISGNLDVTFMSCEGLGLQPPSSDQLTLTKQ